MNFKKITRLVLLAWVLLIPLLSIAQDEDVLFQAFDWNVQNQPAGITWYDVVSQNSTAINEAGIDVIWMPPPSNAASPQGYLPRELYNFNSSYGTESQLRNLINQYHDLGIKVLSDIVVNHRVGTNDAVTFTNPAWPTYFITADDEGRNFVNYPVEFSINGDYVPGTTLKADGSNGTYAAARDLDHQNPEVRQEIKNWMSFLKNDLGFDGWRYDFVHGYDPIYNKEYNDATDPYFAVGELLESSRIQTNNWVNFTQQSSSAFDFNTKVSLQNAIRDNNLSYLRDGQGRPSGMIGINPGKSVTFLDNHDTGAAQQCCGSNYVFPGGETNLRKGYAYILTHPGNPMIFWTHFFDAGSGIQEAIKDLIAVRKSVRLHANSTINIVEARNDLYAAYIDGRSGRVAMKIGDANWSPNGNGWSLQTSGNGYAVWTNTDEEPEEAVPPYTVHFYKPQGWNAPINAYFFDAGANTTLPGTNGWPGQQMTNTNDTNWYTFTVTPPAGVTATNLRVIFNDGTNQTTDLARSTDGWYKNSNWSNNCPSNCSSLQSSTVQYYFQKPNSDWGTANIYLYNKNTNTTLSGTPSWPGSQMDDLNNTSWAFFTINKPAEIDSNAIGVVFNNGSGQQTVDLTRGVDGWFTITGSTNGKSTGFWSGNCPTDCSILENKSNSALQGEFDAKVIPNPLQSNTSLYLTIPEQGKLQVFISNLLGQRYQLLSKSVKKGRLQKQLKFPPSIESGLYFVTISLNGKVIKSIKVIKN
ncbi:starch-binding protein [Aquimarina brevivitae]|uniref:Putative secreted protein (Por secretion system target) n=1 Tax=Aquimarina brevivitae TaxID=323412 RepID=A0A4Q7P239_9FLAO|nr:starch-binding protein [Aquimarina brevivitae]RZS93450.1 putative secreted protein (Por secretion system target) [Aquimarina brevivitae]